GTEVPRRQSCRLLVRRPTGGTAVELQVHDEPEVVGSVDTSVRRAVADHPGCDGPREAPSPFDHEHIVDSLRPGRGAGRGRMGRRGRDARTRADRRPGVNERRIATQDLPRGQRPDREGARRRVQIADQDGWDPAGQYFTGDQIRGIERLLEIFYLAVRRKAEV